jgi:hypothetical protein
MTKAIYGMAGALALSISPAWAADAKVEKGARGDVAAKASTARVVAKATAAKGASKGASEGGTGSGAAEGGEARMNPIDVNLPHAERWLLEREGYRDGGY